MDVSRSFSSPVTYQGHVGTPERFWDPTTQADEGIVVDGTYGYLQLVGVGSTFIPPSGWALATPINKVRLRYRQFSSLYTDVSSAKNFTSGRVTLYGLKRTHAS